MGEKWSQRRRENNKQTLLFSRKDKRTVPPNATSIAAAASQNSNCRLPFSKAINRTSASGLLSRLEAMTLDAGSSSSLYGIRSALRLKVKCGFTKWKGWRCVGSQGKSLFVSQRYRSVPIFYSIMCACGGFRCSAMTLCSEFAVFTALMCSFTAIMTIRPYDYDLLLLYYLYY